MWSARNILQVYLVGDRGAAAKHCRGGCARQSDPRDVGFNLSASPWHPVKTVFLFLLSTSYPCPMQCTLTHFSCCTGHTTYSPEGGVHNNTCRGSSESTIQVEGASCCQPVADAIIHLQSGSPFRPKRAVSSVPFTRQTLLNPLISLQPWPPPGHHRTYVMQRSSSHIFLPRDWPVRLAMCISYTYHLRDSRKGTRRTRLVL